MHSKYVRRVLCGMLLAVCWSISYADELEQKDPLEGFNRVMFAFNDKLDIFLIKPIATFYNKVMPKPLNKGVHNFFNNLNTIPTIANDILQANFYQAANDTWRLGINTTIGIGGLFDVAERMKLEPYTNDFGLTMARWGYKNSTYLVLPFFGVNTIRDGIGLPVDYFAFSVYPRIEPESLRYELFGLWVLDRRAQLLKTQDVIDEAALDKYVFMRNAYLQRRNYQIEQNEHRGACDCEKPSSTLAPSAEDLADNKVESSTESTTENSADTTAENKTKVDSKTNVDSKTPTTTDDNMVEDNYDQ